MQIDYIEQAIRMCQSRMAKRAIEITDITEMLGYMKQDGYSRKELSRIHQKQKERHIAQQTDKKLLAMLYARQKTHQFTIQFKAANELP